jgi:hypothetical protein
MGGPEQALHLVALEPMVTVKLREMKRMAPRVSPVGERDPDWGDRLSGRHGQTSLSASNEARMLSSDLLPP